jgi:TonB family protein
MRLRRVAGLFTLASFGLLLHCATPQSTLQEAPVPQQYAAVPRYEKDAGIQAPKAIRRVEPLVPGHLIGGGPRRMRATVEALITAEGRVEAVWYSSGDREWAEAVAKAVRQWQFEPATRDGQPIAVRFLVETTMTSTGGWRNRP